MQKAMLVALVLARVAAYTTLAISAEDLAAAVKERRQMVKAVKPFDAEAAAKGHERDQRRS